MTSFCWPRAGPGLGQCHRHDFYRYGSRIGPFLATGGRSDAIGEKVVPSQFTAPLFISCLVKKIIFGNYFWPASATDMIFYRFSKKGFIYFFVLIRFLAGVVNFSQWESKILLTFLTLYTTV